MFVQSKNPRKNIPKFHRSFRLPLLFKPTHPSTWILFKGGYTPQKSSNVAPHPIYSITAQPPQFQHLTAQPIPKIPNYPTASSTPLKDRWGHLFSCHKQFYVLATAQWGQCFFSPCIIKQWILWIASLPSTYDIPVETTERWLPNMEGGHRTGSSKRNTQIDTKNSTQKNFNEKILIQIPPYTRGVNTRAWNAHK